MNITLIGSNSKITEFQDSVPEHIKINHFNSFKDAQISDLNHSDVLINFDFDENMENIDRYEMLRTPIILLSSVLAELPSRKDPSSTNIFGINGLSGFIQNECWEVTNPYKNDSKMLVDFFITLNKEIIWVKNQIGMVAPRILFQILKEADQTYLNNTAIKEDINLAMKLGTNYPKGPFEWINEFTPNQISKFLELMTLKTKNARYQPSEISN